MSALEDLWAQWRADPTEVRRTALVAAAQPVVRTIVRSMRMRREDFHDMVAVGQFGLLEAIDTFDQARGVKLETFLNKKVRWAVREALREADQLPRWTRQTLAKMTAADEILRERLHRPPTDLEVAGYLEVPEAVVRDMRRQALMSQLTGWTPEAESYQDPAQPGETTVLRDLIAAEGLDFTVVQQRLGEALEQLDGPDRMVVVLYYVERQSMPEIGKMLGVATSMVSKIRDRALEQVLDALSRS